jgi:hypothetical protein
VWLTTQPARQPEQRPLNATPLSSKAPDAQKQRQGARADGDRRPRHGTLNSKFWSGNANRAGVGAGFFATRKEADHGSRLSTRHHRRSVNHNDALYVQGGIGGHQQLRSF